MNKALRFIKDKLVKIIFTMILVLVIIVILCMDTKKAMLITGESMEPTIKSGTLALIKSTSIEDIEVGDIICFKDEDGYIVHKVVEVYTDVNNEIEIKTKGDANKSLDRTVVNNSNYVGELGISIWITDILLELLPRILGGAITILLVIQANIIVHKREKRRAQQNE